MDNAFLNAQIQGTQYGRIRRLSGFRKGHRLPEDHYDAVNDFVRKIGHDEVKTLADSVHAGLRSTFGYKRKQIEYVCEDGAAAIKTPDFDLSITITQDEDEASNYALQTSVNVTQNPEVVFDSGFCSLFNPHCDKLVVEFERAVDVEAKIDLIEEKHTLEPFLEYEPDCSSCVLTLPEPNIRFQIRPEAMTVTLPGERNLYRLIEHCDAAFKAFATAGLNVLGD